jgi:cyclohexadienyl dehydratase
VHRILLRTVLLLLLAAVPAQAQTVLDTILARGTLRVGLTGDYRPFSIKDGSGKFEGFDVDMAESMAKGLGVKLEIVPTAWPTLLADLQGQKFDVGMGGISVTLDRAKTAFFSTPVMRTGKAPITRCSDQARFTSLGAIDQPGVRVITNPGGTNERFARANLKQAEIVVFPNNAAIFEELVAHHADVMMTDAVETRLQQRLHPELCAVNPDQPFDFSELAYLLPRDPALKAWVDQWLHIQGETGEQKRLLAKWLS